MLNRPTGEDNNGVMSVRSVGRCPLYVIIVRCTAILYGYCKSKEAILRVTHDLYTNYARRNASNVSDLAL
jgi:hypothetical protein